MNRILKSGLFVMLLTGVMLSSCKKEYDVPPITPLPFGDTLTIGDVLNSTPNVPFNGASVCGIVTADEQSGNLYKMIFIQDRATGKAIELRLNSSSAARIGDSVRVYLDSTIVFSYYHNLPQLSGVGDKGFNPDGHLVIYPYNNPIEPKTVTIADIKSGDYVASLVKLDDVEFVEKNAAFCNTGETTNRHLVDASSPNSDDNFVVRTSNYANFAYDYLPESSGSLVAIASIYNSTYQLLLRSKKEMNFSVWGGPATPAGEIQSLPYTQVFGAGFGTYMSYSVLDDDHVWTYEASYNAVVMQAHLQQGDVHTYYANEDWLISSPVELPSNLADVKMTMNYMGRYFDDINHDVTIWVSTNYAFGNDPTSAQWTQVPSSLVTSSNWSDPKTVELSLAQFIGQTITVAVKYVSTDASSGTMEIMSISIQEGGDEPTPPTPGVEGDGSRENPYTVNDIIALGIQNSDGNSYWVKDYIVGTISTGGNENVYVFAGQADIASNLVLSSDVNTSNEAACVPVQLPAGAVRAGLNLMDNPNNYKQEVLLYGTLEKYFSVPGVKNVTYAEINGNSLGTDPDGGGVTTDAYLNESLLTQASFDAFSTYSVAGSQEWYFDSRYGAVVSGYDNGTSYANEDWLISPAIDLSGSTHPVLSFDHTRGPAGSINVGVSEGYYTVWVTNGYSSGNPNESTWVELTGVNHATTAWAWVSSGALAIPDAYKTANCRIALRYKSINGASATWEVKNVVVKEQ